MVMMMMMMMTITAAKAKEMVMRTAMVVWPTAAVLLITPHNVPHILYR